MKKMWKMIKSRLKFKVGKYDDMFSLGVSGAIYDWTCIDHGKSFNISLDLGPFWLEVNWILEFAKKEE